MASPSALPPEATRAAPARRPRVLHVIESASAGSARYVADLLLNLNTSALDLSLAYSLQRADERFHGDLQLIRKRGIATFHIPM
ncbi:MAG: hypothetical protein M3N54_15440, partial [Acidobacteriota bacterium]|nr:hypothetical protein [Acidobacteriota bacterium]